MTNRGSGIAISQILSRSSLGSLGKGVNILLVASFSGDDADVGNVIVRAVFVQEEGEIISAVAVLMRGIWSEGLHFICTRG